MLRALVVFSLVLLAATGDYVCNYKGNKYNNGKQFTDDCKLCLCTVAYGVMCTERSCPGPGLNGGGYNCNYKGKVYRQYQAFAHDCNWCLCVKKVGILCTQKSCPNTKLKEGNEYDCVYNGKMYKKGERFTYDCNVCFCIRNRVICTEKRCDLRPYLKKGDIDTCYCNGVVFNRDQNLTDGGCSLCTCEGVNAFICKEVLCNGFQETDVPREKDVCRPNGMMYNIRPKDIQSCRKGICPEGLRYYCAHAKCYVSDATKRVNFTDSCYFKDKLYHASEHFLYYCKLCYCDGKDIVLCDITSCDLHLLPLKQDIRNGCKYIDSFYERGQTFTVHCNECYCPVKGPVTCIEKPCPPYLWLLRIEDSCEYNGFFIYKYEEFMDDNCQVYTCLGNDRFTCKRIPCNAWADSSPVDPLAVACGTHGKVYEIFDEITNEEGNVSIVQKTKLLIA